MSPVTKYLPLNFNRCEQSLPAPLNQRAALACPTSGVPRNDGSNAVGNVQAAVEQFIKDHPPLAEGEHNKFPKGRW